MISIRRLPVLAGFLLAGFIVAPNLDAQSAAYCSPGTEPVYVLGVKSLHDTLGAKMGDPLECEHTEAATGDAHQQTSKGLAFYRKSTNAPTFTNGWEHWALTERGLLYWTGTEIDPPVAVEAPGAVTPKPTETPTSAGGSIIFQSFGDGNAAMYVMNADGSSQTSLTNVSGFDFGPAWSPDGSKIAFALERDGKREIYVMNADGSAQTNLTNNSESDEGLPAWSPDGSKIAFDSFRDGNWEIYVMNADGSAQTNLTNSSANDFGPAWSPVLSPSASATQASLSEEALRNAEYYLPDCTRSVRMVGGVWDVMKRDNPCLIV